MDKIIAEVHSYLLQISCMVPSKNKLKIKIQMLSLFLSEPLVARELIFFHRVKPAVFFERMLDTLWSECKRTTEENPPILYFTTNKYDSDAKEEEKTLQR